MVATKGGTKTAVPKTTTATKYQVDAIAPAVNPTHVVCQMWVIIVYLVLRLQNEAYAWLFVATSIFTDLQAPLMSLGFYLNVSIIGAARLYGHDFLNRWYYEPLITHHMEQQSVEDQAEIRQRLQPMAIMKEPTPIEFRSIQAQLKQQPHQLIATLSAGRGVTRLG